MFITWQFISGWRSSLIFTTLGNIHTLEIFIVCLKISRPGGCNGQNEQNESLQINARIAVQGFSTPLAYWNGPASTFSAGHLFPIAPQFEWWNRKGWNANRRWNVRLDRHLSETVVYHQLDEAFPSYSSISEDFFFSDYSEDYHTFLLTKLCDRQSSITYCLVTIKSRWFSRFSLRIHWSILWNIDHCFQRSTFLRLICFISICNHWILRWRMFVQMWSNDHKDYWADFN